MNKWLKKFDDVMSAAAFAEQGEFQTARQMLDERRTVMLALRGEKSDANAFRYAVSTCQRIGADIEIIHATRYTTSLLKQFKTELKSKRIDYLFIKTEGCVKENVLKYTDKRPDILFVVVESSEDLDMNCKKTDEIISKSWIDLKCPLVVVSNLAKA